MVNPPGYRLRAWPCRSQVPELWLQVAREVAEPEALTSEHLIHPRRRGEREALRVLLATRQGAVEATTAAINHLKALVVSAPDDLRAEIRALGSNAQVAYCAKLRDRPAQSLEHRMTIRVLRSTAQRIQTLRAEAKALEEEITALVSAIKPELLEQVGIGAVSAAQILVSWSHPGRFRSEAAFAAFAGTAPIPASSGLTNRHRLNRSGDRQLNRALHTIILVRARVDPETRTREGSRRRAAHCSVPLSGASVSRESRLIASRESVL
ncbi:transposase [Actinoallomurus purpureus]|uniref:transposase n=1 Tax=Actinoallomurus purpureus TaxID=478114 RepID=UPI003559360D